MNSSTKPDVNGLSVYGQTGANINPLDVPAHGDGLDSPLKISHSSFISGKNLVVPQGGENAVDINVCDNVSLEGDFGLGPDLKTEEGQVLTVKASRHVSLSGTVYGKPGRMGAHVQLGNHSDQGARPTAHVTLDLVPDQGRDGLVYLVTGNVLPWTIHRSVFVRWLVWPSVQLAVYVYFKWLVRFAMRIPKGTKGPGWL